MTCPVGTDVERAAALLRSGGLVAFATETVYGLGADALNVTAVARVFDVKGRPRFDPLIVHVSDTSWLSRLTRGVPEPARRLAERFWPGPLTLVLPKTELVPDLVTSGLPTVAVRMPDHPLAQQLLRIAGVPVAAPSANPFGRLSPTRAEHVAEQLGDRIDYILDGGPCRVGVESTVIGWTAAAPVLLRPGGVMVEQIEEALGQPVLEQPSHQTGNAAAPSPGMLPKHYAPRTPLVIGSLDALAPTGRVGFLLLSPRAVPAQVAAVELLSESGDLVEAASRFFDALRRLDAQDLDVIIAEPFPEHGLGRALNDRLRRAAAVGS